jgi:ankyrin repeat protein
MRVCDKLLRIPLEVILLTLVSHFIVCRGAQVEVKNKKGNSPLWLAANGGHLNVVELLYNAGADIDSQDNRKVLFSPHLQKSVIYSQIYIYSVCCMLGPAAHIA